MGTLGRDTGDANGPSSRLLKIFRSSTEMQVSHGNLVVREWVSEDEDGSQSMEEM